MRAFIAAMRPLRRPMLRPSFQGWAEKFSSRIRPRIGAVDMSLAARPGRTSTGWPSPRGSRAFSSGRVAKNRPSSRKPRPSAISQSGWGGVMSRAQASWARRRCT